MAATTKQTVRDKDKWETETETDRWTDRQDLQTTY